MSEHVRTVTIHITVDTNKQTFEFRSTPDGIVVARGSILDFLDDVQERLS